MGGEPELEKELVISVMTEEIDRKQSFTRLDGMKQTTQVSVLLWYF